MSIIVATKPGEPTKTKGDLLEQISADLLRTQSYDVETEIRKTACELDLLCKHQVNAKEIYAECKAYGPEEKIQADVIKNLYAIKGIRHYSEAWLITTCELGKDAKGLVDDIKKSDQGEHFSFYTPEKLIDALVNGRLIISADIALHAIPPVVDRSRLGKPQLLLCEYGYYWILPYKTSGKLSGIMFVDADTNAGTFVEDKDLLRSLSELQTPYSETTILTTHTEDGTTTLVPLPPRLQDLSLSAVYRKQIDDLSVHFDHPHKQDLGLSDVFVFQDLEDESSEDKNRLNAHELTTAGTSRKCLVLGEDLSGKTALAHQLQIAAAQDGRVALYLSAEDIKRSELGKFLNLLKDTFKKQYSSEPVIVQAFEKALEHDRSGISLFIDNIETCAIKQVPARLSFFHMLEQEFPDVLLFANKSIELELLARSEAKEMFSAFTLYKILQLGHVRRDELIGNWLTVGEQEVSTDYVHNKKREIAKRIEIAAGTNFVPTYPFYLLSMLHMFESGHKSTVKGSSYAELYNFLITQALVSARVRVEDLDFYQTYLSYVAHYFFEHKTKVMDEADMRHMFAAYCKQMDLEKSFDEIHQLLDRAKLIKNENGAYSFFFNYCHYYFIAKYLADGIEKPESRQTISMLVSQLYRNEYANIVIFLVHHSKNPAIIDSIMDQARQLFNEVEPMTLLPKELRKINDLLQEEIKLSYEDSNPRDNRTQELESRDELDEVTKDTKQKDIEKLDRFGKTNLAFKIIEVLGQIANNYYGSLEGATKAAIIEELYNLGTRGLRGFLGDFDEYIQAIRQDINRMIESMGKEAEMPAEKKEKAINEIIYAFTQFITMIFLNRMSSSVASRNLFPTIDRVLNGYSTPAAKIMRLMVHLDFPGELKQEKKTATDLYKELGANYLAKGLVRLEVMHHLYKFEIPLGEKQSICSKLDIDFVKASQQGMLSKPTQN